MSPWFAGLMVIPCLLGLGTALLSMQAALDTGNPQIALVGPFVAMAVVTVSICVELAILGMIDTAIRISGRLKGTAG